MWLTEKHEAIRRRWRQLRGAAMSRTMRETALLNRQLDDLIDAWHADDSCQESLAAHLGLAAQQYSNWVAGYGLPDDWTPPRHPERKTMTTVTMSPSLDSDGFLDLSHMRGDYAYLEELLRQRNLLNEAITVYENKFKEPIAATRGAVGFKIDGLPRATFKADSTFPTKKYIEANPQIAALYMRKQEVFDLEAFKRQRGAEYDQWRAKSFRHISPTKKG